MAIDIARTLTSAGIGVVDEVLETWDEKSGRTESFRTAKDIGRLAAVGVGLALQVFMPRQARLGETLTLSGMPLLVKSIAQPVRQTFADKPKTAASSTGFVPRMRAPAPAPSSLPGVASYPAPIAQDQFRGIRLQ